MDVLLDVFQKNRNLYFSIAYKYTKNTDDTEDVLQDLFYKALRADRTNIQECDLKKWMVTICVNAAKDYIHRKGKLFPIENIDMYIPSISDDNLTDFYYREVMEAALISIPINIRPLLKENIVNELPIRAIAKKYNISRDKLKYWKNVLKKAMRIYFKE